MRRDDRKAPRLRFRQILLLGPFETHAEALDQLVPARERALERHTGSLVLVVRHRSGLRTPIAGLFNDELIPKRSRLQRVASRGHPARAAQSEVNGAWPGHGEGCPLPIAGPAQGTFTHRTRGTVRTRSTPIRLSLVAGGFPSEALVWVVTATRQRRRQRPMPGPLRLPA
jgi:hypothetical protein